MCGACEGDNLNLYFHRYSGQEKLYLEVSWRNYTQGASATPGTDLDDEILASVPML